jgi:hypothetical protein
MKQALPKDSHSSSSPSSIFHSNHGIDEEHMFYEMYQRQFLPFVRAVPYDEASSIAQAAATTAPEELRAVVIKNIITSFGAVGNNNDVRLISNLQLQPDWHWREIYLTLHVLQHEMESQVQQCLGLDVPSDTAASNAQGKKHATFLMLERNDDEDDSAFSIKVAPLVTTNCYRDRGTAIFLPDYVPSHLTLEELNRQCYYDGMFQNKSNVCVFEGLSGWSEHSRKYHLIFPLSSLRIMFLHQLEKCKKTSDAKVKKLLSRERVVQYTIISDDTAAAHNSTAALLERNLDNVVSAIQAALTHQRIALKSHQLQFVQNKPLLVLAGYHQQTTSNGLCATRNCFQQMAFTSPADEHAPQPWITEYCKDHQATANKQQYLEEDDIRRAAEVKYDILTFDAQLGKTNFSVTVRDALDGQDKVIKLQRVLRSPLRNKRSAAVPPHMTDSPGPQTTKPSKELKPNEDMDNLHQWSVEHCLNFLNLSDSTQSRRAGRFEQPSKARQAVVDRIQALIASNQSGGADGHQHHHQRGIDTENMIRVVNLQQLLLQRFFPHMILSNICSASTATVNSDIDQLLTSLLHMIDGE